MEKINQDIVDLVIARLSVMPATMKLYIGGEGGFTKDELIEHVKCAGEGDEIGKLIIDMHVNYIKSLACVV